MSGTKRDGPADGETLEAYFTRKAEEEAAISLRASMADLESGRRVAAAVNFNEGGELLNPAPATATGGAPRSLKLDLVPAPVVLEEKTSTARETNFSVDHHHDDEDWEHKMHMIAEARAQFQRLRADVGVELSEKEDVDGVIISSLLADGAAQRAGLKVGDVIDHVNFKETNDIEDFNGALQSILAGDSVPFEIRRTAFGNTLQLTVVVQTGAKGLSADQLRQLRATASGHVDDADARERRNKSEQGVTTLSLGTTIEHDEEHDQDWELKQQLVSEARARFSSLVPWVGCEFTTSDKGVKLTAIQAEGAAQAAGLQVGDVIEQINFHDTKNREQFDFAVASILAGDSVPFRIERDGKESNIVVIVGAVGMSHSEVRHLRVVANGHPDEADLKEARHRRDHGHDLPAGVGLGAIEHHDDDWETRAHIVAEARNKLSGLKADLGVVTETAASGEGLVVTKVVAGGSSFLAGVQAGDIIDHINFTEVSSPDDFVASLSAVFPGDNVPVQLTRGTSRLNLVIAAAADGVPLQSVRDLRRVASGQVSEHDLREHKALEASHPIALAPVLHGHDAVQDDETEARAQLVASSRAKFSALKADVGVELEEVTGGSGVRITKLVSGGGAETAGVRVGDVVDHVNFAETSSVDEFSSALSSVLPGDSVPFQLHRATGERATLVVQAGAIGITASALRDLRRLAAGVVHDHDLHHS